jgi:hypothetical protein
VSLSKQKAEFEARDLKTIHDVVQKPHLKLAKE